MPDVTFKYAGPPGTAAPYGDPFTVRDIWAPWLKDIWTKTLESNGYKPEGAPFTPTYESGTVSWPGNDGTVQTIALNPLEFPTMITCQTLALMYAVNSKPLTVVETPFIGLGPVVTSLMLRLLVFPNGKNLPAYQMANWYTNNPPEDADALCKEYIARVWP